MERSRRTTQPRTHPRALAAALAAISATLLLLTGCAQPSTATSPAASAAPVAAVATASASPSATSEAAGYNDPVTVAPGHFSGEAVEVFGAGAVATAYAQMADLFATHGYAPQRIVPKAEYTAADFTALREVMTPSAQPSWDTNVASAIAGDADGTANVNAIALWDVRAPGWAFRDSGPLVVNQTIETSGTGVNRVTGSDRLWMKIEQHAEMRMTTDGQPVRVPVARSIDLYLTPAPAGAGTWLIDGYEGTHAIQERVPDA